MPDVQRFIGLLTPQANPTVELEFREYFRGRHCAQVARLVSREAAPAARLRAYLEQLPDVIARYDTLPLAAIAFACTGSAYLLGAAAEGRIVDAAATARGCPVVTATQAIEAELKLRRVTRLAILAPYPADLCAAAVDYWQQKGVDVVAHDRIDVGSDTRAIYALTESEVAAAIDAFDPGGADVVLLSGTGMPTLAALAAASRPTISSNLCLAAEVLRRIGDLPADTVADANALSSRC